MRKSSLEIPQKLNLKRFPYIPKTPNILRKIRNDSESDIASFSVRLQQPKRQDENAKNAISEPDRTRCFRPIGFRSCFRLLYPVRTRMDVYKPAYPVNFRI